MNDGDKITPNWFYRIATSYFVLLAFMFGAAIASDRGYKQGKQDVLDAIQKVLDENAK